MAEEAWDDFALVGVDIIESREFGGGNDSEGEYLIAFPLLVLLDLRDITTRSFYDILRYT